MGGKPTQQALPPLVVVQHRQVGIGEIAAAPVDHLGDSGPIGLRRQPQRTPQTLLDRGVAARAGEDERDRGQQALAVQGGDHVRSRRRPVNPRSARAAGAPAARLPVGQLVGFTPMGDVAHQFRVDAMLARVRIGGLVVEQVEQALTHQNVLPQRYRPVLVHHHGGVAPNGLDPAAELFGVADRG